MKLFLWNLADWCVLAIIVLTHDMHTLTAERLLDAAGAWVGVVNAFTILHFLSLLLYKESRLQLQEQQKSWSQWENINYWSLFCAALIVFSFAGWIFTFSIRLIYAIFIEIINRKN